MCLANDEALGPEERCRWNGTRPVPERVGQTDERDEQADRHDELGDERGAGQPAHQDSLDDSPEERRGNEHRQTTASAVCMPALTFSSQYTYVRNIPIAPWAKLKMPDVVYVTTRPDAATP